MLSEDLPRHVKIGRQRKYKKQNPAFELLWRIIACCLFIDLFIYCFFHLVMGVSVPEGIQILQNKTALMFSTPEKKERISALKRSDPEEIQKEYVSQIEDKIVSTKVINQQYPPTPASNVLDKTLPTIDVTGNVFTWTDKNGTYHSSNTTFPQDNDTVRIQTEINTYKRFTHVKIANNKVIVPMTIFNKNQRSDFQILLDTGCTHTILPFENLNGLNVVYGSKFNTIVANGETLEGRRVTVDRIQIGSQSENNFTFTVGKVVTSGGQGLLGIDFLKNHPFRVDFRNQLIVWE